MYTMYQIILKNEYDSTTQSFSRLFPQGTTTMDVFKLIHAEFNGPLEKQNLPINSIEIYSLSPWDYPQGHWYRDQMTNINTQTR